MLEIEALEEMLKEVKEDKTNNARQDAERKKKCLEKENEPIGEEEDKTNNARQDAEMKKKGLEKENKSIGEEEETTP